MALCPKCLQEIDRLKSMHTSFESFHLDEQGKPVYEKAEDYIADIDDSHQYFCPKCQTTLALNEEEAIRVLKSVAIKN